MDDIFNNLIKSLSGEIKKRYDDIISDFENTDLRSLEYKEKNIQLMINCKKQIDELSLDLNEKIIQLKENYIKEISIIESFINKYKGKIESQNSHQLSYSEVVKKNTTQETTSNVNISMETKLQSVSRTSVEIPQVSSVVFPVANEVCREAAVKGVSSLIKHQKPKITVNISPTLTLDAFVIAPNSLEFLPEQGKLFYIPEYDHFAIKICGHILHGNMGTIYTTNDKTPKFIKPCRYNQGCNKENCDYYHDPVINSGSKDIKNYTANSFLFAHFGSNHGARREMRRFGSRDTAEIDIKCVTEENVALFEEQLMHDIISYLLLKKFV